MIQITDLHYAVAGQKILDGITDVWETSQMIGIIGPNGSGKTTLLRHIYGALPSRDAIWIDGVPAADIRGKERAKQIAVLSQKSEEVESRLTVAQVISLGRYPHRNWRQEQTEADEQIVAQVISQLGLEALSDRELCSLSGGEFQRTMIAKAFAQQTKYIVLDEPTNHLDITYKLELMEHLKRYAGTVIVTLHDLALAARYCDYVLALDHGQICYRGTVADVFTAEHLSRVFHVPIYVHQTDRGLLVSY